jgi:hypothetical protein
MLCTSIGAQAFTSAAVQENMVCSNELDALIKAEGCLGIEKAVSSLSGRHTPL